MTDERGAVDAGSGEVVGDDLSGAPVPDLERIARCTCSVSGDGSQVELWGPPAGILSIARWLRSPTDAPARTEGEPRASWDAGPGELALVVLDAAEGAPEGDLVEVATSEGRCTITGSGDSLSRLAEIFEMVGVYALDLRWAPVERRQLVVAGGRGSDVGGADGDGRDGAVALLRPGSPALMVASAYPMDP